MTVRKQISSARNWLILTFVVGVLPLWLSSTEMWDGVIGIHALTSRDWGTMHGWILNSNWYLTYVLFLLADVTHQITGLPLWVFFKLWISLMVLGIAFEAYRLAIDIFEIPPFIAEWVPALIFSFPLWYVFFSYTPMVGHLTCAWLALHGYRLIYSEKKWKRAGGFIFITLSFQLASNCAFLLSLEAVKWLLCKDKSTWSYRRSIFLLLLALGAFAATRVVWPPVSTYVGYNQFLDPRALSSWVSYAKHIALFGTWLVLLVPIAIGAWWTRRHHDYLQKNLQITYLKDWKIWVSLALLTFSACMPYVAVGLGSPLFAINLFPAYSVSAALASASASGPVTVWYGGWGARHMLLMLIPLVLSATWATSRSQRLASPASNSLLPPLSGALIIMVTINLFLGVSGHWAKLERLAQERTVVISLAVKPVLPDGEVELLFDKRIGYLVYMYEANSLLHKAYNDNKWSALMYPDQPAVKSWGDNYRKDIREQSRKWPSMVAKLNVMENYSWGNTCRTVAKIGLPTLSSWDILWRAEHSPKQLPPAYITPVSSNCTNANEFWR